MKTTSSLIFETTPKIICALGSIKHLAPELNRLNISRVLIVTDAVLVNAGVVNPLLESLKGHAETVLYTDVFADPPQEKVLEAVAFAKTNRIDGVIGFGGGSSMDTAKLVALLATSNQHIEDIYGVGLATGKRLPLIQIPTTAGTGSEVTNIAIVTTPSHEKKGVVGWQLYPDIAVLDAETTLSLPPHVTAATGVDAMVHAIEAYTSKLKKNPVSDSFALQALKLLYNNIDKVIENGKDVEARSAMLLGSCLAGIAFANAPVAAVHALAYPLGGHFKMTHGHSNSVVLPGVLTYNAPQAKSLYAELARHILPDVSTLNDEAACEQFILTITQLVKRMPFELQLSKCGVKHSHLDMLATDAMKITRLLQNNPREMTYEATYKIYEAIL
jgi:alcohol dehydrogenase class IV